MSLSVADELREFGFTVHIRPLGEEVKAIKRQAGFKARRWVVERTRAWIGRYWRMSKNDEYLTSSTEAMVSLSMLRLMLSRLAKQTEKLFVKYQEKHAA